MRRDGSLVLFDGRSHVNRGADFGTIARDCSQPALIAAKRTAADSYENAECSGPCIARAIAGTRSCTTNSTIRSPPPASRATRLRAIPAATLGNLRRLVRQRTFVFSKPGAPAHTVAPAPYAWVPPAPGVPADGFVEGYFNPSNIVQGKDGYYYSFLMAIP